MRVEIEASEKEKITSNENHESEASLLPKFFTLKIPHSDWEIKSYELWPKLFKEENETLDRWMSFAHKYQKPFRRQICHQGLHLLYCFLPDQKKIFVGTPQLSFELFALKSLERVDVKLAGVEKKNLKELREFIESFACLETSDFPSVIEESSHFYQLDDLTKIESEIEESFKEQTQKLLTELREYKSTWFERVTDLGLGLTAKYALIRIHILKFLAILPSLDHDKKGIVVKRAFLEAFRRLLEDNELAKLAKKKGDERALEKKYVFLFSLSLKASSLIPARLLAWLVRASVRKLAKRFIAGETIEKAEHALKELYKTNRDVTLDQLGELVVSEKEADHYRDEVIKLIKGFSLHVPAGELNLAGINRAHVSIKVSALCSDFRPEAYASTYELVAPRLRDILLAAKEHQVFLNIDAEHYHYRDCVLKIYGDVLKETPELKDFKATGIVIQAYLRDGAKHLRDVLALAQERNLTMPIRLAKGAYWDAETIEADAHLHPAPQFLNKEETDINFRLLINEILKASPYLQLCLASHNFSDHAFARALREKFYPKALTIEHQCLHMTYEALSQAMARSGFAVRNYVPVGSLLVGMAYLVRRIMENSSQVGVLTIMRSHKKEAQVLSPLFIHQTKKERREINFDPTTLTLSEDFHNVTPLRSYLKDEWEMVEKAYEDFRKNSLGKFYGEKIKDGRRVQIFSPSEPEILVGEIDFCNESHVHTSLKELDTSFSSSPWATSPWITRSLCLLKAALRMQANRPKLAALISYEAGKTMAEALADVDEAIDFLNFYARQEGKLFSHHNQWMPRGIVGVIAPWNFPLAIACGMTAASLVAGNAVILKPAEQTPLIASELAEIFWASGVPKNILHFLPGEGSEVGQALVSDPRVAQITFTGSKKVGQLIQKRMMGRMISNPHTNHHYPSKVIAEMGGKNAIIVTGNAEPDETVAGILASAFFHAGQKCSAASRVIIDTSLLEVLSERLYEAVRDLKVGKATDADTVINPLISAEETKRLREQVKQAGEEAKQYGGKILIDRSCENLPGHCLGPAVFILPPERAKEADSFARRELFGPVVHLIPVNNLDQAIDVFNTNEYALTGGVFGQSQDDIDYLAAKMECGNIYINRNITGARVAIEPFGGFKNSGTGPKAGGKHYLSSFHVQYTESFIVGAKSTPATVYGKDEDIQLAYPSGLTHQMRGLRMGQALDELLLHFESIYRGIYGEHKEALGDFKKWIDRHYLNFITKEHWNRSIPGQLSYDDYSLTLNDREVVALVFEVRPYFSSLMSILSAILLGKGVTILAMNPEAYQWWDQMLMLLKRSGLSLENMSVYHPTQKELEKIIARPTLQNVIIDGDIAAIKSITELSGKLITEEEMMGPRHFLTPLDSPAASDFKSYLLAFVEVRSFAINTMRHGAPLTLLKGTSIL